MYVTGVVGGKVCFFLTQLLLANWLGPVQFGIFVLAYSIIVALLVITPLGTPQVINKYASPSYEQDLARFLIITRAVGIAALIVATLVTLVLSSVANPLARVVFHESGLAPILLMMAPVVMVKSAFLVLDATARASLNGHLSGFYGTLTKEVSTLALVLVAMHLRMGLEGAAIAYVAGNLAGLIVLGLLTRRLTRGHRTAKAVGWRDLPHLAMVRFGLQSALVSGVVILNLWADRVMLGLLSTAAVVGIYHVAAQLVGIAITALALVNVLFEPLAARYVARGDGSALASAFGRSTEWGLHAVLPLFVVFAVLPEATIGLLFGPGYAAAASVLLLLCVGQIVRTARGPIEILLLMQNRQPTIVAVSAIGLAANVALNVVLIPQYAAAGAALASAVVNGGIALTLYGIARRQALLSGRPLRLGRPLLAGGLALAGAWVVQGLFDGAPDGAAVLGTLVLSHTVYWACLWSCGGHEIEALRGLVWQAGRGLRGLKEKRT